MDGVGLGVSTLFDGLGSAARYIPGVGKVLGGALEATGGVVSGTVSATTSVVGGIAGGLGTAGKHLVRGSVSDALTHGGAKVKQGFVDAAGDVRRASKDARDDVRRGVRETGEDAATAARRVSGMARDGVAKGGFASTSLFGG